MLQRIPLIVGQGIAWESFTARHFDATRAREILLVNEIFSDYKELMKGAEALAEHWEYSAGG
ncbi:MAG: hypothetical protein R2874_07335 [Desulfobacterales bacterium]